MGKGDIISSLIMLSYEADECTVICTDGEILKKDLEKILSPQKE